MHTIFLKAPPVEARQWMTGVDNLCDPEEAAACTPLSFDEYRMRKDRADLTNQAAGMRGLVQGADDAQDADGAYQAPQELAISAGQPSASTASLAEAVFDDADDGDLDSAVHDLDTVGGLEAVRLIHLNDSKNECGSRKDRHEHIGEGEIGLEGFRILLNDERFAGIPMVLETPKEGDGIDEDKKNLATLRGLIIPP